jgi:alkylation response protein AidB-like acyl-CoA dehydrogenase
MSGSGESEMATATTVTSIARKDWPALIDRLGPRFAARAALHDSRDSFVAENYAELKGTRVFSAGVPFEFGGGGASHAELAEMLRRLGRHCGSTALALAMHTQVVTTAVWRWRNENAPLENLLRRVAEEELALVSSFGSDWLASSGKAKPVAGGFKISGRKIFSSGSPGGGLLMTSAVLEEEGVEPQVLHFELALDAPGVKRLDNWRTLGMRGTGSSDIVIDDAFVPETAIVLRRPQGVWSPIIHATGCNALPLIYSVYLGIAEAARDLALGETARKREETGVQLLVGEMETELAATRLAVREMIELAKRPKLDLATMNEMLICRTLAGRHAIGTVEKAMEAAGGAGFYRSFGLERLFRDVQAARHHPLAETPQLVHSGRVALGLDVNEWASAGAPSALSE